jgi:hypothetical protein
MKIGILTFWESKNNYGQILQLFALQTTLNKLGHDSFLIKYRRIPIARNISLVVKLNPIYLLRVIVGRVRRRLKRKESNTNDEERRFDAFKKEHIVFGEYEYLNFNDLKNNPPVADVYVVGSDQVWNNNFSVSAEAFLLGFGDKKVKRVAYAASFGQKILSKDTKQLFEKYIHDFDSVSVREQSGLDICSSLNVSNPQWVLDPTLLFTKEDWSKMLGLHDAVKNDKSIFIYTLGNSEIIDRDKFIGYVNSLKGYRVIHASANNDASGNILPTIPEWVNNIKNAEMVITTSFHGMVFCLLNNTNFIILPNTGHAAGMNERILSLLTLLGLEDHLIEQFSESKVTNIFSKKIDWNQVNTILEHQRQFSIGFIQNAII